MLISTKHKFIYVHIYKTAGSTITDLLADHVDTFTDQIKKEGFGWQGSFHFCGQHCTLQEGLEALELYGIDYRNYFIFTFVRNPYDWVFSIWNNFYRSEFGNTKTYQNQVLQNLKKVRRFYRQKIQKEYTTWEEFQSSFPDRSFPSFLQFLNIKNSQEVNNKKYFGLYDQLSFIENNQKMKLNFIGKFESLQEDIDKLFAMFDLPLRKEIPHRTKSQNKEKLKWDWDQEHESKEIVNQLYHRDFEAFEYEKII